MTALCFGARQVITTVAPGALDAIGLGWLALRAAPMATIDTETHSCDLFWLRNGLGSLSYTLTCTAKGQDLEISNLHLAAIDATAWQTGAWTRDKTQVYTYEEQWPVAQDSVPIRSKRTWSYEGEMAAGAADWLGGAPRALIWTATIVPSDMGEEEREDFCDLRADACRIELASVEPFR